MRKGKGEKPVCSCAFLRIGSFFWYMLMKTYDEPMMMLGECATKQKKLKKEFGLMVWIIVLVVERSQHELSNNNNNNK